MLYTKTNLPDSLSQQPSYSLKLIVLPHQPVGVGTRLSYIMYKRCCSVQSWGLVAARETQPWKNRKSNVCHLLAGDGTYIYA